MTIQKIELVDIGVLIEVDWSDEKTPQSLTVTIQRKDDNVWTVLSDDIETLIDALILLKSDRDIQRHIKKSKQGES